MDGYYSKKNETDPQLLDLISKDRAWLLNRSAEGAVNSHGRHSDEKKLELRLGPPGEEWTIHSKHNSRGRDESLLSLSHLSNIELNHNTRTIPASGPKKGKTEGSWIVTDNSAGSQGLQATTQLQNYQSQTQGGPFFKPQSIIQRGRSSLTASGGKESLQSQSCSADKMAELQSSEKKTFSPASATAANTTAVPNKSSLKRPAAAAPVVGWPPVRSFRRNLASSSSNSLKPAPESPNVVPNKAASEKQERSCQRGLFVKINMDGIPIGRKVNLTSYDNYEKLSAAVDELFRDLLAAQMEEEEEKRTITGLLDGNGEYTLVYEDNEGDRMLVGDVPWHMFISTVKRLRVLKSSDLSTLCSGIKHEKGQVDVAAMK